MVQPLPLVAPWLASLDGTSEETVRAGRRWLQRHGYIAHVADTPGRPTQLWQVKRVTPMTGLDDPTPCTRGPVI